MSRTWRNKPPTPRARFNVVRSKNFWLELRRLRKRKPGDWKPIKQRKRPVRKPRGETERARYLDQLEKREGETWERITAHIQKRQPGEYDKAVTLLTDLHDLAVRKQRISEFRSALGKLRQPHTAKPSFLRRLAKAEL